MRCGVQPLLESLGSLLWRRGCSPNLVLIFSYALRTCRKLARNVIPLLLMVRDRIWGSAHTGAVNMAPYLPLQVELPAGTKVEYKYVILEEQVSLACQCLCEGCRARFPSATDQGVWWRCF